MGESKFGGVKFCGRRSLGVSNFWGRQNLGPSKFGGVKVWGRRSLGASKFGVSKFGDIELRERRSLGASKLGGVEIWGRRSSGASKFGASSFGVVAACSCIIFDPIDIKTGISQISVF